MNSLAAACCASVMSLRRGFFLRFAVFFAAIGWSLAFGAMGNR
jgi:hypothetical protein